MKLVTIYHNPRCSKSRNALALLKEKGIEPKIVEYLKNPPDKSELKTILQLLGMTPRDLMRKKEKEYKAHNLQDANLSEDDLLTAMVSYPKLMERPVVLANGKAALGRPTENILTIL